MVSLGSRIMAKLRGKQKWLHPRSLPVELWAIERVLDSKSQKLKGQKCELCDTDFNKLLGQVRSVILRTKVNDQKTLKRWINPAPNHKKAMMNNAL